jgi:hypothetical protein
MATGSGLKTEIGEVFERAAGNETTVLAGPALKIVRAAVFAVFATAAIVYVLDLFALWDEANRLEVKVGDAASGTTIINYFGLTAQERDLLTDSATEVPGWYPVFVVTRQIILTVVAVAIAWLVYSRRPRHWMAYLATLYILLAPVMGHLIRDVNRLDGSLGGPLYEVLSWTAVITLFSFLWLFPDGRFRRPLLWLLGVVAGLVIFAAGFVVFGPSESELIEDDVGMWVAGAWFLSVLATVLLWGIMGIAIQVWRYNQTKQTDRQLARWNLAFLIAVPLWFMPFDALHDLFSDSDVGRYTVSGFVWEQIHETLYLIAPVLLGLWVLFLVRRQGWWDFQTLWNRTAVYGIGMLLLAVVYGGVIGVVTLAASPLNATAEQVVAVLAATAAVAFAYGPLLGRVRHWVDTRWFPRRAEVDALALVFADEVRASASPGAVPDRLRAVLRDELDPEHLELWTVDGGERQ